MKRLMVAATLIVALNVNAQFSGAGLQIKGQSSTQLSILSLSLKNYTRSLLKKSFQKLLRPVKNQIARL